MPPLEKLEKTSHAEAHSPAKLISFNVVIGVLVIVAHGGALIVARLNHDSRGPDIRALTFTLPLALYLIVSGLLTRFTRFSVKKILKQHTLILLLGSLSILFATTRDAISNLAEHNRYTLNGFFVFLVAYPFYLLRQTYLLKYHHYWMVDKIHIIAGSVAGAVYCFMIYKMFQAA